MTKRELTMQISEETGIAQKDVETVITGFTENIKKWAATGENTYLRGFGTFAIKTRAAKTARNIAEGTAVHVPAKNVIHFKPSPWFRVKQLKREIQEVPDGLPY